MGYPIKAVFLDLSGVLYEGKTPVTGAAQAVQRLRERGLMLRFVTNTATQSSREILAMLAGMGIRVEADELFTAPIAARHYLQAHSLRPYCLLHPAIQEEFSGFEAGEPNCVLLGDARQGLTYDALNIAFRLCQAGAPLIGIGMNKYFKDEQGLMLDAGPFIRAIEWAADTRAIIMGKPSAAFFAEVVASTPFAAAECLMVGDDLSGDVEGAISAGLQALLVRTGKFQAADEQHLPAGAGVIDSIAELPDHLFS